MRRLFVGFVVLIIGFENTQKLQSAESRQSLPTNVTPDQVVEMSSPARVRLLANYAANSNRWPTQNLLPIAIAYAMEGHAAKSESTYIDYLKVRPDDARANRGLGLLYLSQKRFNDSIQLLGKAWRLHDARALPPLVAAYLATDQRQMVRDLIPDMLRLKKEAKADLRDFVINGLLAYAVTERPFDSKVFEQTIDGLSENEILAIDGAPELVIEGLRLSGEKERASTLERRLERQKRPNTKDKIL